MVSPMSSSKCKHCGLFLHRKGWLRAGAIYCSANCRVKAYQRRERVKALKRKLEELSDVS